MDNPGDGVTGGLDPEPTTGGVGNDIDEIDLGVDADSGAGAAPQGSAARSSGGGGGVWSPMEGVEQAPELRQDPAPPDRGNYLFTVGLSGRGKSTFQRHLLWYVEKGLNDVEGPQYRLRPDPSDPKAEQEFTPIRMQWSEEFREQRFPEPTTQALTRFYFEATPVSKDLNGGLDFGFWEISGEHFRNIYVSAKALTEQERNAARARVPARLERFLKSSECKIVFVFLANGLNCSEDDDAFSAFLQYLSRFEDAEFAKRTSLALVVSYPEAARQRILNKIINDSRQAPTDIADAEERRHALARLREAVAAEMSAEELQQRFLNAFFHKTAAEIQHWNNQSAGNVQRAPV